MHLGKLGVAWVGFRVWDLRLGNLDNTHFSAAPKAVKLESKRSKPGRLFSTPLNHGSLRRKGPEAAAKPNQAVAAGTYRKILRGFGGRKERPKHENPPLCPALPQGSGPYIEVLLGPVLPAFPVHPHAQQRHGIKRLNF